MQNKRGSALITALFIMTLIAISATAMSLRLQLDIYRTRIGLDSDELYLASQAVTFWAMDKLSDKTQPLVTRDANGMVMTFPDTLQHLYPGIKTTGGLYDLQARFNLNNVQNTKFQPYFYGLLENTLKKTDALQRSLMLRATSHWISPYQPERGHDELFTWYSQQKPPYFPGYQPMQHVSEFRLVHGVNASIYESLAPFITALPEITPININTAPIALLMPLGNGLSTSQAEELLEARGKNGFPDLNAVSLLLRKLNIPNEQITLESTYFLSIATTSKHDVTLTLYTTLKRHKDKQGKITLSIISETMNAA